MSLETEKEIELENAPKLERKQVVFDCPKHGKQEITLTKLYYGFNDPYCPICEQEKADAKKDREAKVEAKQQAEAKKNYIAKLFNNAAIPVRFKDRNFDGFKVLNEKAHLIKEICQKYALNFPENFKLGKSMLMIGTTGTGKTHLAISICNHIMENYQKTAVFCSVVQAVRRVKETYSRTGKETEQEAINSFVAPDLLVLDEIGVQVGSEAEKMILFEILNGRYEQMKPTILLSNLDPDGVKLALGDRVVDRLKENGGIMLVFDWQSYRGNQKTENL